MLSWAGPCTGAGQAGCVSLLTPNWLSLCPFILSLLQSLVGDSRGIKRVPSLKALFVQQGVPWQDRPGEVPGQFVALAIGCS